MGLVGLWRREWDSNPRYLAVNTLSKRAPSATRPSLRLISPTDFNTFGMVELGVPSVVTVRLKAA